MKPTWPKTKRMLGAIEFDEIVELIRGLYDLSPANRDFLHARLLADLDQDEVLERYRKRVTTPFYPSRGLGKLDLASARQAIREYEKTVGNVEGALELMLKYVECGTTFTLEYGDINSAFYSSLTSVYAEFVRRLSGEHNCFYPQFRDRIERLATAKVGWGYGDFLYECAIQLREDIDFS